MVIRHCEGAMWTEKRAHRVPAYTLPSPGSSTESLFLRTTHVIATDAAFVFLPPAPALVHGIAKTRLNQK